MLTQFTHTTEPQNFHRATERIISRRPLCLCVVSVPSVVSSRGFTLVEVLVASVIASVVAVGTMSAVVTVARMTAVRNNPTFTEASVSAQETVESFRSQVACDTNSGWFDPATCAMVPGSLPQNWTTVALPGGGPGTLANDFPGAKRCYRVRPATCQGLNDCLQVDVQVCWNDLTTCSCP